ENIYGHDNAIEDLDVSGLTNLILLDCSNNQLISLYAWGATNLGDLQCQGNQLTDLTDLYVLDMTNLDSFECQSNNLGVDDCPDIQALIDRHGGWYYFEHSPQNDGFIFMDDCTGINGTITDTNQNLISDAVIIANGDSGPYSTTSDLNGSYTLSVEPGTYDVTCIADGYLEQTTSGVQVDADQIVTINFSLPFQLEGCPLATVKVDGNGMGDIWVYTINDTFAVVD
ncbi:MAG: carboxypeptidase regulatory-like domain-containing protein, partial [Planctomycetes bacterium]|nr:carboxypeptidase regulatory-like domain-containing protein [Planctomycetota bacterium]